jgi:drug/metabolite transporter (DMT)-like permease
MNKAVYMLFFAFCVFVSSCSQILLKKSANKKHKGIKVFINVETIAGYSIFFIVTLVNIVLYKQIDLSSGALLESLSYIFVPALSWFFFREKLKQNQIIGILFIVMGIIVFAIFG